MNARYVTQFGDSEQIDSTACAIPTRVHGEPCSVVKADFDVRPAQFSPDRMRIAYTSDESGQSEIYVGVIRDRFEPGGVR